ncbi:MAG TPA: hypothetical protein VNE62_09640 [Actinomycetota bacterium]|nr:hypothetical protein [Actinomycetota bacterium]
MALVIVGILGACSAESPKGILESGPRVPDEQGVVADVSVGRLQFQGGKAYAISDRIESFTTRTHEVKALALWKGKYVHAGIENKEVVWVAGIGVVPKDPPRHVTYTGVFRNLDSRGRAVFEDGTVLALAAGVKPPRKGETVVTIDPLKKAVVSLTPQ